MPLSGHQIGSLLILCASIPFVRSSVPIEDTLRLPLADVQHLNILLRDDHVHDDARNMYLDWFLKQTEYPFTVSSYRASQLSDTETDTSSESFVVVTTQDYLAATMKRYVDRSGAFFYVLSDSFDHVENVTDVFRGIWTTKMAYKMYLLTEKGVYIYDPFDYNAQQESYGRLKVYTGERSLERLLFTNMRGYPLRVQIFRSVYSKPYLDPVTKKLQRIEGVDWKITQVLQERLNFTYIPQEPNPDYFGERDEYGNYNGAIGMLIRNEFDLCMSGFFVKDYMVPEMHFTVAVYDDKLCIYVPKAKRVPQSILPIFSVRGDLWAGFISIAFLCILIWWLLRRLNLRLGIKPLSHELPSTARLPKTLRQQFVRISIDTWVVWVRCNIVRYPPFYSERLFILSLCLVSVIFGAIFESSLATVYIHPMHYKDINTLNELDQSGLTVVYKYTSMGDDLFFSETSPLFASLNKKLYHLKDLNADVIRDISVNGGKAGVTRYTSLMSESLHFILSKRIWVVAECPKYYTMSYVLAKNAPWEEAINDLLLRFLNAGLINKYIGDMQTQVDIAIMKQQLIMNTDIFKVLTIADLQLAFYVVLLGNTLAALAFIVQNVWHSRHRRLRKTH